MRQYAIRCFMITGVVVSLFLMCSPVQAQTAQSQNAQSRSNNEWAPFIFLLGNWTGVGTGQPGEGVGWTSFSPDLDGNILVRKNKVKFPPRPGEKSGMVHEDLLIIYKEPGGSTYSAIYFDNEAHVINYAVSFPTEQPSVVFESEGTDKTPRFRLVYTLGADSLLNIDFLAAPPGREFRPYTSGKAKRSK